MFIKRPWWRACAGLERVERNAVARSGRNDPGIAKRTAEIIMAEIGIDMTRFATPAHLASWAGLCPGNNESAGKHRATTNQIGEPVADPST